MQISSEWAQRLLGLLGEEDGEEIFIPTEWQ